MSIDIYEDNAGKILIVDNRREIGLIIGGVDSSMFGAAKDDCYGLEMSDDPQSDYGSEFILTGQALQDATATGCIATFWSRNTPIQLWEPLSDGGRVWSKEPGIAGKWYLGIER